MVFAAVACARALYTLVWGPSAVARRRLRSGVPTLVDGAVATVTGVVRMLGTLEAPLDGAPCVAYVAWGKVSGGPQDMYAETIRTQELVPFELVTGDGVVRVEASTVDIANATHSIIPRKVDREAKFLVAHGFDARLVRTSSFQQAVIAAGDKVRVHGLVLVEQAPPSDASGYRETERHVRIVAHGAHPLTVGPA